MLSPVFKYSLLHVIFALLSGSLIGGGLTDNPELLQRSFAETNLHRFSESLLQKAVEHDAGHSLSSNQLLRLLESSEGQDLARAVAMRAMLDHAPSNSGERTGRAMKGWLGSMCDTVPWIAWLVACEQSNEVESQREHPDGAGTQSPYIISLQNYVWATCIKEGSSTSNEV